MTTELFNSILHLESDGVTSQFEDPHDPSDPKNLDDPTDVVKWSTSASTTVWNNFMEILK